MNIPQLCPAALQHGSGGLDLQVLLDHEWAPDQSVVSFGPAGAATTDLLEHAVLDDDAAGRNRLTTAARWLAPTGRGAPAALGDVSRRMPRLTRRITVVHAALFLLTHGRVLSRWFGNPILVLETVGRRTGTRRATPLVYLPHRNDFAVVPANAGAHRPPAWWLNLQAAGEGFAVLNGQRQRITPTIATGLERDRLWQQFRAIAPIEHYRRRARRTLPIIVLTRDGAATSLRRRTSVVLRPPGTRPNI